MAKSFGVEQTLDGVAHIDTCVTVVDAASLMMYFEDTRYGMQSALLKCLNFCACAVADSSRLPTCSQVCDTDEGQPASTMQQGEDGDQEEEFEDERNLVNLLIDQLEFADVIIVNKVCPLQLN